MRRFTVGYSERLVFETIVVDAENEQDAINQYYAKLNASELDIIKANEIGFDIVEQKQ